jgi:hypothetical protein
MVEFVRTSQGGRLLLDDAESDLIRRMAGELRALLTGLDTADDPVIERLFPATYEDPAEEASYQALIGEDLVQQKLEALDVVSTSLGPNGSEVCLEGEILHTWLACLTDLRLAIGTRLEVDEEIMSADVDASDANGRSLAVLHWLGSIQEGILRTCAGV